MFYYAYLCGQGWSILLAKKVIVYYYSNDLVKWPPALRKCFLDSFVLKQCPFNDLHQHFSLISSIYLRDHSYYQQKPFYRWLINNKGDINVSVFILGFSPFYDLSHIVVNIKGTLFRALQRFLMLLLWLRINRNFTVVCKSLLLLFYKCLNWTGVHKLCRYRSEYVLEYPEFTYCTLKRSLASLTLTQTVYNNVFWNVWKH